MSGQSTNLTFREKRDEKKTVREKKTKEVLLPYGTHTKMLQRFWTVETKIKHLPYIENAVCVRNLAMYLLHTMHTVKHGVGGIMLSE